MRKYIFCLTLFFSIFNYSFSGSVSTDENTPPHLVIDYVGSVQGFIETCGCHSGDYGGIARRATYLAKVRKEYPNLLVLNGGDLNVDNSNQGQLKADFMFQAFQKMNYDAFNIGEREFMYGLEYLQDKVKENPIFISANLVNPKTQKPLFPPYIIKSYTYTFDTADSMYHPNQLKSKINVAVVGLIGQSQALAIQSFLKSDSTYCVIADPEATLTSLMPELRKKADVIVVLAHMPQIEVQNLIKQVPGIDILLPGHDHLQRSGNPLVIDHTITGTNGDRGRFAGQLKLWFDLKNQIRNNRGKEIPLGETIAKDSEMVSLVQSYKKALRESPH